MNRLALLAFLLALPCCKDAFAFAERDDYPWSAKSASWQEQEMVAAIGQGWYLPVGPTGIRAKITHEHPQYFTVKYVFKNSPAAGKVNAGDIIVGANGTMLKRPHTFGRGSTSWEGPLTDMAKLIEDSQGKDGTLELIVWPGGNKDKQTKAALKIEAVGRFSPTYPFNCPRSDKLVGKLCDYLVKDLDRSDAVKGQYARYHMTLALMASGDKKYQPVIKDHIYELLKRTPDAREPGKSTWHHGYAGILLGEYYRLHKDSKLLPQMKELARFYREAMEYARGACTHNPTPALWINNNKGYGAMAAPASLALLSMSLFKASGVPYDDHVYQAVHQSFLRSVTPDRVKICYCFAQSPDHASITLQDPKRAQTPDGPGFQVPTGMKDIGSYTITWPTPSEGRGFILGPSGTDTAWVEDEKESNEVYMGFMNDPADRIVVRAKKLPEPKKPYNTTAACAEAPVGLGALAHYIGNKGNTSWEYLGQHCGNACALGSGVWFDGHAAPSMHQLWVGLGAYRAEKEKFREFMDGVKWWFIMQQTHDGSYYVCPNRDRPSGCNGDPGDGPHVLPSATAALILSLPRHVLLITGADSPAQAGAGLSTVATSSPMTASPMPVASIPVRRTPRKLNQDNRAKLDIALQATLVKLSDSNEFKVIEIPLSKTLAKVSLVKAESGGKLTYQVLDGENRAAIEWKDLTASDHAALSRLVAYLRPNSSDAQAMAGVYVESIGRVEEADKYFEKAGKESREKLERLFSSE
jgi:hypothetical protein